jgi:DNA-binding winged helix-turn-helix (wHTH) protein
MIGTVRNVGYRFVTPEKVDRAAEEAKARAAAKPADEGLTRSEQPAEAEIAEEAPVRPAKR